MKMNMNEYALSKTTIAFHWVTGIFFIVILGFGLYMDELPKGPEKFEIMGIHKSLGLAFLFVALMRVTWRLHEGNIPSLNVQQTWLDTMAKGIHLFLLIGTVLMPISGLMMSIGGGRAIEFFGTQVLAAGDEIEWLGDLAHEVHEIGAKLIILALLLHIAGALKHQFMDKDGTLSRMLGR